MILYTMMPNELVFPAESEAYSRQQQMTLHGIPVIVERNEQEFRIVRVLSTDPQHYLDSRIIPGTTFQIE